MLFDRQALAAAAAAPVAASVAAVLPAGGAETAAAVAADDGANVTCAAHPRQPAPFACASCGTPLCATCVFELGSKRFCGDCAVKEAQAAETATKTCPACGKPNRLENGYCVACGSAFGLLSGVQVVRSPPPGSVPVGVKCAQHPEVDAVNRCRVCASGVCATCDFTFAGNVHVCPRCVEQQATAGLSPGRRTKMLWALGLAGYGAVLMSLLLTGTLHRMLHSNGTNEAVNTLLGFAILIPAITGTSLAFSSYDRRLSNPLGVKAAVWANSILLAIYMFLTVLGAMRH